MGLILLLAGRDPLVCGRISYLRFCLDVYIDFRLNVS